MAEVTAHIWYDLNGVIVAVGHPLTDGGATPVGDAEVQVLETRWEEAELETLHKAYSIDVQSKALMSISTNSE